MLLLVNAANDDVTTMLIQEDEYKQSMDSDGASRGVCPNHIVRAYDDCQSQMACAKVLGQMILKKNCSNRSSAY